MIIVVLLLSTGRSSRRRSCRRWCSGCSPPAGRGFRFPPIGCLDLATNLLVVLATALRHRLRHLLIGRYQEARGLGWKFRAGVLATMFRRHGPCRAGPGPIASATFWSESPDCRTFRLSRCRWRSGWSSPSPPHFTPGPGDNRRDEPVRRCLSPADGAGVGWRVGAAIVRWPGPILGRWGPGARRPVDPCRATDQLQRPVTTCPPTYRPTKAWPRSAISRPGRTPRC